MAGFGAVAQGGSSSSSKPNGRAPTQQATALVGALTNLYMVCMPQYSTSNRSFTHTRDSPHPLMHTKKSMGTEHIVQGLLPPAWVQMVMMIWQVLVRHLHGAVRWCGCTWMGSTMKATMLGSASSAAWRRGSARAVQGQYDGGTGGTTAGGRRLGGSTLSGHRHSTLTTHGLAAHPMHARRCQWYCSTGSAPVVSRPSPPPRISPAVPPPSPPPFCPCAPCPWTCPLRLLPHTPGPRPPPPTQNNTCRTPGAPQVPT